MDGQYTVALRDPFEGHRRIRLVYFVPLISHIVLAACIAHVIALRTFPDRRLALQSQYAMSVLMVGYKAVSLWIVAQPIVETGRHR